MRLRIVLAGLASSLLGGTALAQAPGPAERSAPPFVPHTLSEAMAEAYSNNPQLQAERAHLRSVDEDVPTALAGWRPTVTVAATAGYVDENEHSYTAGQVPSSIDGRANRIMGTVQATITQPVYMGGRTTARTHEAVNQVMAERANLLATEESVLLNTVSSYVTVIEDQDLLNLNINNEQVLTRQLVATNDRFRVGEITRTDVAQAEASLAGARAARETAYGNLQAARAQFARFVGVLPPDNLQPPQPLVLPVKNERQVVAVATNNNPSIVQALFNVAVNKDAFDVAYSALMPNLSAQGSAFREDNQLQNHGRVIGAEAVLNLSVPIYQGGSEYAAVRQARQNVEEATRNLNEVRRETLQTAVAAYETLIAAQASLSSDRASIAANAIALQGVEREAIVGSRTTLDVLNQQQYLLTAQTTLVQQLASLLTASYQVAYAIGRLTARDLNLNVPYYDDTAYYKAVKDRLWGTGDYATHQPGR